MFNNNKRDEMKNIYSKEHIKMYGKNLDYTFADIKNYLDGRKVDSLIFQLLDGRVSVSELDKAIKGFVREESESYTRGVLSQQNKDYNKQEDRISDDPEIR